MPKSIPEDWKTPLGYFEKAITEVTRTGEEIQEELKQIKTQIHSYYQEELECLKAELKNTRERIVVIEKINDQYLSSQANLKEELEKTNNIFATFKENTADLQGQVQILKANFKQNLNALRIEHGVWEGTARDTPGWSILDGQGKRIFRTYIRFSQTFITPPNVVVGISYFDILKNANSCIKAEVAEVDSNGFYINLYTSLDTKIWAAGMNWLAYGN